MRLTHIFLVILLTGKTFLTHANPTFVVEAKSTTDYLDNGYANWNSQNIDIEKHAAPREIYYAGFRQTRRFALNDSEGKFGAYLPMNDSWTANVEGSYSPTHRVLPEYSLNTLVHRSLPMGWGIAAGIRYNQYDTNETHTLTLLGERYWGSFRAAYSLYRGKPQGASAGISHRVELTHYYEPDSRIGFSMTSGREVERTGVDQTLVSDVNAFGIIGRHALNTHWATNYELSSHRQGGLYMRRGLSIGLRYQF